MSCGYNLTRRNLLTHTAYALSGAIVIAAVPRRVHAQYSVKEAFSISTEINALEEKADTLALPPSKTPLPGDLTARSALDTENIYLNGMPRLLALIERAQGQERGASLADNASVYLSDITRQEHSFTQPNPKPLEPRKIAKVSPPEKVTSTTGKASAAEYRELYSSCVVNSDRDGNVQWHVKQLKAGKAQYAALSALTAVPWYFIGILHALEASFNFSSHLYNGDTPLSKKTTHDPKRRPRDWQPPYSWQASAQHALTDEGFVGQESWALEDILYRFELYNGLGYRRKSIRVASPYLWSFSSHYKSGKFVKDSVYSASTISQQCGAAVMLKYLEKSGEIGPL
ncbi:hypothetical protein EOS93_07275 [Rhizobium sp. RMa-01]|uniref:hypothetical protein n=1 Tax=unclassified Rhizobium TaxID=2613769 RepID=UPI000AA630DC|nr:MULTISPECIES: hypothetical protein [unclassified Rhizobium]RVU12460.1 hypothetical protein EOS93_07275 [Rhizobium sp. RMa-01]